jgi:uncharacterized protein YdhG (YjbR/CyaY superfamily)
MIRSHHLSIDSYISTFPKEMQKLLVDLRNIIKKAAPAAEEIISYNMPAFKQNGILVYFAGYKNHIGFYPSSSGIKAFQNELTNFKNSKGAVQFPLDKPLPVQLISKIVTFRKKENLDKAKLKNKKRTCSKGHVFSKSSDCPACPICSQLRKPLKGFLTTVSAPARRALESKGIKTEVQLSKFTQAEILRWHGIGKTSIPKLKNALKEKKLTFKK